MVTGNQSGEAVVACKVRGRLFKRASGVALAAALVPLGAVAVPAQAVTVTASGQTQFAGSVTGTDSNNTNLGYTNAQASDVANSILASASGSTGGQTYVQSLIFNPGTGGSGGSGGSGGVAQAFAPTASASTYGPSRQADANLLYEATLTEGFHKFIFHINPQILSVALNDYDPSDANSAMTGMKVTIGQGIGEQVLYHWESELVTSSAGTFFTYDDITIPGGVFEPNYSPVIGGSLVDEVYAPGFDVGLNLGYRAAGTVIRAEYYASAITHGVSESFVGSLAQFGDPFDANSPDPSQPFQIITNAVGPVPEPASAALVVGAMGALGTLAFGRRRRE